MPIVANTHTNAASVFGIMTRPQVIGQTGASSYAGVEFKPWGIAALGLPTLLVDEVLQFADWVGERDGEARPAVRDQDVPSQRRQRRRLDEPHVLDQVAEVLRRRKALVAHRVDRKSVARPDRIRLTSDNCR